MREFFHRLAKRTADLSASPWSFIAAVAIVLVWVLLGPVYHFSDTWQLIINTGTTIVTFLSVFLIQNTQNRDTKALHLKLDELIRAVGGARNSLVDLEHLSEAEISKLEEEFHRLREKACRKQNPGITPR